jgi:hypothetical protein
LLPAKYAPAATIRVMTTPIITSILSTSCI